MAPSRGDFICQTCLRTFRSGAQVERRRINRRFASIEHKATTTRPFRVGIIGSGPAGFYAAARLLERHQDAIVDMYERLPAPFGLVRYGVAPDHPEVKNCQDRFDQVAQSPRFNFIGNIAVGIDIPLRTLKPHYDAFLFAYGASRDRPLGVPGEHLKGIVSAREFVGWYNGLPEYENLDPDLQTDDTAHIIGNGNVALDVARMLLSDLDLLRKTDISGKALDILSRSEVKHIHLYGRRGPMQAAFTIKEIRELINLPNVGFEPLDSRLLPQAEWISKLPRLEQRKYRLAALLGKGSKLSPQEAAKSWSLQSLLSPSEFTADETDITMLANMKLDRTEYNDTDEAFKPSARVHKLDQQIDVPARLVFRSIGYKSSGLPGLMEDLGVPFDSKSGIIPNDMHGRVLSPAAGPSELTVQHVDGCYATGWVKTGPTGVIATTMDEAFSSADIMLKDWEGNVRFLNGSIEGQREGSGNGWEGVTEALGATETMKLRPVSWQDWRRIDAAEKERGQQAGKLREKFKSIQDMLAVLD